MKKLFCPLLFALAWAAHLAHAQTLTLLWDKETDTSVLGYHLYQGVTSGVYNSMYDTKNVTTYTINGLTLGTTYYFAVSAYNVTGEGPKSNQIATTPNPFPVPLAPTSLHVTGIHP